MSEDRYEPYEYGNVEEPKEPQEPQFAEPDLEVAIQEELAQEVANFESQEEIPAEEPQFAEPSYTEQQTKEEPKVQPAPRYDYSSSYSQQTSQTTQQPKNSNNNKGMLKVLGIIGLAVVFGVVASVVFKGTNYIIDSFGGDTAKGNNTSITQEVDTTRVATSTGATAESNIADVAEGVMPSVVSITNLSIQEVENYFFGGTTQYESESSGSGIIIGQNESELLVVTNNHVVEGSETLTVTFIDGSSAEAQIKGTDSDIDLAIIVIALSDLESSTLDAIKVAVLGDSDTLRVGETTIAIGNALGYGQSVTAGIVSALGCSIEGYEGTLIQTDAAINPGNSGGALLNANGEVIGINTAKVSDESVEGMGYAIPISDVLDVLEELMTKETRTKVPESERGVMGIEVIDVTPEMSQYYNIPEGVYVSKIQEGGAADEAGLPLYCVIVGVEGYDVDSWSDLQEQLQYYRVGDTVELTIMVQNRRGYEEETIKITLEESN